MSDNKLLTENTIRRFMKLANVDNLTETFIGQTVETRKRNDEVETRAKKKKKMEEETEETTDTIEEEEEVELEENFEELDEDLEDLEEQEDEMDMEMDMEMDAADDEAEPELGAADISLTEEEARLLIDLGERLKEAMEDEGPADEDDEMADVDAVDDMEVDAEEDPAMGVGGDYSMQEELVNEVLKRVTKRLVAAKLNK